jgi:RimJ/RimL family protein N-acetyltransferase
MQPLAVRSADPNDAEAIARLIDSVGENSLVSEIDVEERAARIRSLLEEGHNVHFVAEASGEIVGELALALGDPGPASLGFSVSPGWRRRGVAKALIKEAFTYAKSCRVHKLSAEVFPENEAALTLLERNGFREEGRLKAHFRRSSGELRDVIVLGRVVA